MIEDEQRKIAFKFRVKQEFEVIIYYESGINAESAEEASDYINEDVLDLAYNEEGLVVKDADDADNSNPYIALVTTHEPDIEMVYSVNSIPKEIQLELKKQGLLK